MATDKTEHGVRVVAAPGKDEASCSVRVGWHGGGQGITMHQLQRGWGHRHVIKGLDKEGLEVRLGAGEDDGKPKLVKELREDRAVYNVGAASGPGLARLDAGVHLGGEEAKVWSWTRRRGGGMARRGAWRHRDIDVGSNWWRGLVIGSRSWSRATSESA